MRFFKTWSISAMTSQAVIKRYCDYLEHNLALSSLFEDLTLEYFAASPLHVLAAEGLSVRIGEDVKVLAKLAPLHFGTERWSLAAKNRDKVAHDYQNLEVQTLLDTMQISIPGLLPMLAKARESLGIS